VQAALEEARQRRAEAEREHNMALIAGYREEKEAERRRAEEEDAEHRAQLEKDALVQAQHNLARVEFRAEQLRARQQQQEERKREEQRLGEEAQRKMEAFRERVISSLGVEANPERAMGATVASALVRPEAVVPGREGDIYRQTGYSDETVFKDVRFKLGLALNNAGLGGTAHARAIMSGDHLGPRARPELFQSNVCFGPPQVD